MAENSESSNSRRLLRLKLTDGHSEITAIEYSHIPSIPDDVVPGTKVSSFSNYLIEEKSSRWFTFSYTSYWHVLYRE